MPPADFVDKRDVKHIIRASKKVVENDWHGGKSELLDSQMVPGSPINYTKDENTKDHKTPFFKAVKTAISKPEPKGKEFDANKGFSASKDELNALAGLLVPD